MSKLFGIVLLLLAATAQAAELRDVRLLDTPDSTRVVFDLDTATVPEVFTLANPDRVVVDFPDASRAEGLNLSADGSGLIKAVRSGRHDHGLRVVLDVSAAVVPKSFSLDASGDYGYRVIVDLYPQNARAPASPAAAATITAAAAPAVAATPVSVAAAPAPASPAAPKSDDRTQVTEKPIVIAVDAGHGGEDPGARGRGGLLEKDVTLAIARRLARKIDAQPGMRAVLTRDGDYYVDLRERTVRARKAQADLFVSIHANAYKDRDMHGTAVYVLSDRGASSEQARWIASHENAADLVGGVKLRNKDDDLAAVLIDISQSATMEASFDLGSRLLDALGKVNPLQKSVVQQAGFLVLKSPDIPSVLVETAFISNPHEEKLLRKASYQDELASSIFDGVHSYFARYRPLQQVAVSAPAPRGRVVPVSLKGAGTD